MVPYMCFSLFGWNVDEQSTSLVAVALCFLASVAAFLQQGNGQVS